MRTLLRWLARLLLRVRVQGDLQALESGRRLVVANHDSIIDGILLGLFLPGNPVIVMSADALRHPLVRLARGAVRMTVLERDKPLTVKSLIRRVQRGETVAIFPEGRVSSTGTVMKVYDSAGVIAAHCDAQVVPVHIRGTLCSRFSGVRGAWPRRWLPRVTLTVQPALKIRAPADANPQERRRCLCNEMLRVLQQMLVDARPRQTLIEALLETAGVYGGSTLIVEDADGKPQSYRQLLKRTFAAARLICRMSRQGETLGIMLPNLTRTVALLMGLTAMRRVAAMLNYSAGPEATHAACVAAGVRQVITSRLFIQRASLDSTVRALHGIDLVYVEDLAARLTLLDRLWVLYALWRRKAVLPTQDPQAIAVVLFTSGSEARPKGVAISHDAMLANMEQMRAVIDFGPNDKFFNALPMYHTYGLTACTLMPLVTGTPLYLYTTPLHYRRIPELVYTRNCTYLFGTSTFLGHYGRHAHGYDFHSLRAVVCGGERLSAEVEQLWLTRFGLRVMEGYGATECGPTIALNTPLSYRRGTVGRPVPRTECRIVPLEGIARGGVLHVRAPQLMAGYYLYHRPGELEPPRSELGPGWYNTGDVVEIDEDGYLSMIGRVKRFAKIAGEMVSLEVAEHIAYTASPEHQHAAVVEQAKGGAESTVLFTTDPGLDRLALARAARDIGAQDLAVPRRTVKLASLPLLGSGKIDYVALTRMLVPQA